MARPLTALWISWIVALRRLAALWISWILATPLATLVLIDLSMAAAMGGHGKAGRPASAVPPVAGGDLASVAAGDAPAAPVGSDMAGGGGTGAGCRDRQARLGAGGPPFPGGIPASANHAATILHASDEVASAN